MRVGYTPIHVSVLILGVSSTYSNCSDAHSLKLRFTRYGTQFKVMILLNCSEASTRVFGRVMLKKKSCGWRNAPLAKAWGLLAYSARLPSVQARFCT